MCIRHVVIYPGDLPSSPIFELSMLLAHAGIRCKSACCKTDLIAHTYPTVFGHHSEADASPLPEQQDAPFRFKGSGTPAVQVRKSPSNAARYYLCTSIADLIDRDPRALRNDNINTCER